MRYPPSNWTGPSGSAPPEAASLSSPELSPSDDEEDAAVLGAGVPDEDGGAEQVCGVALDAGEVRDVVPEVVPEAVLRDPGGSG